MGICFGGGTFRPVRLGQSLNKKPDHSGQTLNFKPDTVYTWVGFLAPRGILHLGQLYLVKKISHSRDKNYTNIFAFCSNLLFCICRFARVPPIFSQIQPGIILGARKCQMIARLPCGGKYFRVSTPFHTACATLPVGPGSARWHFPGGETC